MNYFGNCILPFDGNLKQKTQSTNKTESQNGNGLSWSTIILMDVQNPEIDVNIYIPFIFIIIVRKLYFAFPTSALFSLPQFQMEIEKIFVIFAIAVAVAKAFPLNDIFFLI